MPSVLFVCTANQIRSPFASAVFQKILAEKGFQLDKWKIGSAGTWVYPHLPIEPNLVTIAAELQVILGEHKPTQIDPTLLQKYALIIVMEKGQKEAINYEFPEANYKSYLLTEFNGPTYDIPDPHGMPIEQYRKMLMILYATISKSFNSICNTARKLSLDSILY